MMNAQSRRDARWLPALLVATALVALATDRLAAQSESLMAAEDPFTSDTMRFDARLRSVCFVDAEYGWAVGDRGTIWHTRDGGQRWTLQRGGVGCVLESVYFLDQEHGWAVGGYTHPFVHTSQGVALVTNNGGRSWQHDPKAILPKLKKVRFADTKNGWALGCASEMFPSGIFLSDNGGKSWNPLPGNKNPGWVDGDFVSPWNGAAAGQDGLASMLRNGGATLSQTSQFGLRAARRIALVPPVHGWLVGQGGLVMMTQDLGLTWQTTPGSLPEGVRDQFDFHALSVIGPNAWVAGSPGTLVLHTPDAGRTWRSLPTGQKTPLRDIHFLDTQHGWAVGDLGVILRTEDGGLHWTEAQRGGSRAAMLGIFAEPKDVPLELFAQLSGDEGYLGIVDLLTRRDIETPRTEEVFPEERMHEALVGVGASGVTSAWRFPLRREGLEMPEERILDGWNNANDGRAVDQLQAHLVRTIRMWQPDVIVTHDDNHDPLGHLLHRAVLQAVEAAADPIVYSEQITRAGLDAWTVKRVVTKLDAGTIGEVNITTAEVATRLGRSPAEVAARPRGLVLDKMVPSPHSVGFRIVQDARPAGGSLRSLFTGIILSPGGDARRRMLPTHAQNLEMLRRLAQKRRNTTSILKQVEEEPEAGAALLAQASQLTRGLDEDGSANIFYHLADQYHRRGQWPLAAETFQLLVDRYPDHSLARPAMLWLVQYYASSEAAWRVYGSQRSTGSTTAADLGAQKYGVQQASALTIDPTEQEDRPELAAGMAKQVEHFMPDLYASPELGFPLAVANRMRGLPVQADRFYLMRLRDSSGDPWWQCAEAERWIKEPKGDCPKPLAQCLSASGKPRLDGLLDDAIWGSTKPITLQSPLGEDAAWPAFAMTAYDSEFLYLAVCCRKASEATYPEAKASRARDPDLSGQDRVEIHLDIDRDYATAYQLTVDHRGWVADACWGDSTWNPEWFVATGSSGDNWTAEIAIPLDQLTGAFPTSGTAWAVGIQRIIPGVGFQSWTQPADTKVRPEGFGLVMFR